MKDDSRIFSSSLSNLKTANLKVSKIELINELRMEKQQLTIKLSQELCPGSNDLELINEYVKPIKETIVDIQADMERHTQTLEGI